MRRIIVLDKSRETNALQFAVWVDVPAARQTFYANASAVSAVSGASGAEVAAIQSGAVYEHVEAVNFTPGTTVGQMQAQMIATFNSVQARITGFNPWSLYGTSWDGATWTVVNVA